MGRDILDRKPQNIQNTKYLYKNNTFTCLAQWHSNNGQDNLYSKVEFQICYLRAQHDQMFNYSETNKHTFLM